MQRIVALLVFQTPEARPIMQISAWIDRRFGEPIEVVLARIEAQDHRRFLKSHLPLDALPFYAEVKYIHVARDGRDACMSFHNHGLGFTQEAFDRFDSIGLEDETIGRPYPRVPADLAEFFHRWLTEDNVPTTAFFHFERTWWEARVHPNVLLVHYNDLQADLPGEMDRIAEFLEIEVTRQIWPDLVAAAQFEAMRRDGDALMGGLATRFQGGSQRFFYKGANGRWRGIISDHDLRLYEARIAQELSPECGLWIARG
jgi:aryl sulfotransferase